MRSASGPGSVALAQHSSQMAKANRPAAAGKRPSRSGYSSGSGSASRATRAATQPVPRPIARHGLTQREDVSEEERDERDADPEADVDRRRREVLALGARAGDARVGDDGEDEDAERAEQDLHGARQREQRPLG